MSTTMLLQMDGEVGLTVLLCVPIALLMTQLITPIIARPSSELRTQNVATGGAALDLKRDH
jgi:hypothetical protein